MIDLFIKTWIQRLLVIWGQCCPRVAAAPSLPNGPITQLSPYFTQKPGTIWTASQTVFSAVLDCCLTFSSFNVGSFVVDANLSQAFWKGQWKALLGSGHGGAAQPRDLQSWVHFVDICAAFPGKLKQVVAASYRSRISVAAKNPTVIEKCCVDVIVRCSFVKWGNHSSCFVLCKQHTLKIARHLSDHWSFW